MLQVIKKWRIYIYFGKEQINLIIFDNFYSNMLRKLQEVSFEQEPTGIEVRLVDEREKSQNTI